VIMSSNTPVNYPLVMLYEGFMHALNGVAYCIYCISLSVLLFLTVAVHDTNISRLYTSITAQSFVSFSADRHIDGSTKTNYVSLSTLTRR